MDKVSDLLSRVLNRRGLKGQANASYVVYKANDWIAETLPDLSGQIHVTALRDSVLHIECDHPIAAQELRQNLVVLQAYLQSLDGIPLPEIRISRTTDRNFA